MQSRWLPCLTCWSVPGVPGAGFRSLATAAWAFATARQAWWRASFWFHRLKLGKCTCYWAMTGWHPLFQVDCALVVFRWNSVILGPMVPPSLWAGILIVCVLWGQSEAVPGHCQRGADLFAHSEQPGLMRRSGRFSRPSDLFLGLIYCILYICNII